MSGPKLVQDEPTAEAPDVIFLQLARAGQDGTTMWSVHPQSDEDPQYGLMRDGWLRTPDGALRKPAPPALPVPLPGGCSGMGWFDGTLPGARMLLVWGLHQGALFYAARSVSDVAARSVRDPLSAGEVLREALEDSIRAALEAIESEAAP